LFAALANAQQPHFQKLETVNGIASDRVYCVTQDSKGYLWFGTDAGVSSFDGFTFKNFDNRKDLTANEVFEIYEDSKQRIWFLSQNGEVSFYYDDVLHTSKNVSGLAKLQINSDLTSFCERENGDIVFSSLATGIYLLDSNFNATHYNIASVYRVWENSKNELLALAFNGIYHLKSDGQMNLVEAFKREGHYARTFVDGDTCYIALGDQLFRYTDKIEYLRSVPNGAETTFIDKHNGRFVIGTRTGVYLNYSLSSAQTHQPLFEESVISAALYDREGNLWVSTVGDGVYFSSSPDVNIYTTKSGLALNQISALHKTKNDELFIGYRNGSYGSKNGSLINNIPIPTPTNEPVTQIKTNANGELLILSKSYLTYIDSINHKHYLRILLNDLLIDSNEVYLASNRTYKISTDLFYTSMGKSRNQLGLIGQDLLEEIVVKHRTNVLAKDSHGNVFLGTDQGLFVQNEGITIDLGKISEGLNAYINDIVFDARRGLTYVATRGEGLSVLKGTSVIKRYTVEQNLSSNTCVALELDNHGQLWVGTNQA